MSASHPRKTPHKRLGRTGLSRSSVHVHPAPEEPLPEDSATEISAGSSSQRWLPWARSSADDIVVGPHHPIRRQSTFHRWRKEQFDTLADHFRQQFSSQDIPQPGDDATCIPQPDPAALAQAFYQDALRRQAERIRVFNDKERTMAGLRRLRARLAVPWYVVMPNTKFVRRWDKITAVTLVVTAVLTPFEVALLDVKLDPLFFVNRLIDLIFFGDMCLSFVLAYQLPKDQGGKLVKDPAKICQRYIKSWFFVDLLSILPFDMISLFAGGFVAKVFNSVRALRLVKLLRIARALRIYRRWEQSLTWRQSSIGLFKYSCLLVFVGHWMSCLWILVGRFQDDDVTTWLDVLAERLQCSSDDDSSCGSVPLREELSVFQTYSAALYWSVITITSVGYGDIVAANEVEMIILVLFILLGSSVWAYILGNACNILSSVDVQSAEHFQLLDAFTEFMEEKNMPQAIRERIRSYIKQCRAVGKSVEHQRLVDRLSPQLKIEVTLCNTEWMNRVYYLKPTSQHFIVSLAAEVTSCVYEPRETVHWEDSLFCVGRGVASRLGRVRTAGACWGEDFILEATFLKDRSPSYGLTFVEILTLTREDFFAVADRFASDKRLIKRAAARMAYRKGIFFLSRQVYTVVAEQGVTMDEAIGIVLSSGKAGGDYGHTGTGVTNKLSIFDKVKSAVEESTAEVVSEVRTLAGCMKRDSLPPTSSSATGLDQLRERVDHVEKRVTAKLDQLADLVKEIGRGKPAGPVVLPSLSRGDSGVAVTSAALSSVDAPGGER